MWTNTDAYDVIHWRKSKTRKSPSSCHDGVGVNGGIAPLILRSGARWRMVSVTLPPFYHQRQSYCTHCIKGTVGLTVGLEPIKKGKFRKKFTGSYRVGNPCSSIVQPTAYRTTELTLLQVYVWLSYSISTVKCDSKVRSCPEFIQHMTRCSWGLFLTLCNVQTCTNHCHLSH
jgi:hypothetical protein